MPCAVAAARLPKTLPAPRVGGLGHRLPLTNAKPGQRILADAQQRGGHLAHAGVKVGLEGGVSVCGVTNTPWCHRPRPDPSAPPPDPRLTRQPAACGGAAAALAGHVGTARSSRRPRAAARRRRMGHQKIAGDPRKGSAAARGPRAPAACFTDCSIVASHSSGSTASTASSKQSGMKFASTGLRFANSVDIFTAGQ